MSTLSLLLKTNDEVCVRERERERERERGEEGERDCLNVHIAIFLEKSQFDDTVVSINQNKRNKTFLLCPCNKWP